MIFISLSKWDLWQLKKNFLNFFQVFKIFTFKNIIEVKKILIHIKFIPQKKESFMSKIISIVYFKKAKIKKWVLPDSIVLIIFLQ